MCYLFYFYSSLQFNPWIEWMDGTVNVICIKLFVMQPNHSFSWKGVDICFWCCRSQVCSCREYIVHYVQSWHMKDFWHLKKVVLLWYNSSNKTTHAVFQAKLVDEWMSDFRFLKANLNKSCQSYVIAQKLSCFSCRPTQSSKFSSLNY